MRGPKPAHPIALTAEEVKKLEQLIRAHRTPQTQAGRARLILTAHEHPEQNNPQIAAAVGTTDRTGRSWRARWVATRSLADAPGSGAPRCFSPQVRAQVTAIASSLPRQSQVPLSRWSRAELARRVVQDPSLPRLSASTLGRWLKAERIRPWRSHAWQHIPKPHVFGPRARPVLQADGQARALLAAGIWLLCLDEKTSIQAREGEQPPRPTRPGQPMRHEARYQRRGARQLLAGLSLADGQVYGMCRSGKCFVDFQTFLQQVIIAQALRRKVHTVPLILDNGTTHAPTQLEGGLRAQAQACDARLHFQVLWGPPNASWLDQLEIWFSVLQRTCLQPTHFVRTTALQTTLNEYIAYYNQTAKPINWTYTVEQLEHKLAKQLR